MTMTRADIIQIIFGIHSDEMNSIKDLLRERCKTNYHSDCSDCVHEVDDSPLCPAFWIESLVKDEWEECVQRFTILYNTYRLGHHRGYLEGEEHQRELESEEKEHD